MKCRLRRRRCRACSHLLLGYSCAMTTARDAPCDLCVMYDVSVGAAALPLPPQGGKCLQMQICHDTEDERARSAAAKGGRRRAGPPGQAATGSPAALRSNSGQVGSTATYKDFRLTLDGDNRLTVDVDQMALDIRSPPRPKLPPRLEASPSERCVIRQPDIPKSGSAERMPSMPER